MHKALQALVDTIMLAAGSVELGSAAYSPTDSSREMSRRATTKPLPERDLPTADPGPQRADRHQCIPGVSSILPTH